eukprot:scaffold233727_cov21-Tisochrysis_lutea.AAC.3
MYIVELATDIEAHACGLNAANCSRHESISMMHLKQVSEVVTNVSSGFWSDPGRSKWGGSGHTL